MVSVSIETAETADARLRRVIAEASFQVFEGPYEWTEFSLEGFPDEADRTALALVRDERTWSELVPSLGRSPEQLALFRFRLRGESEST